MDKGDGRKRKSSDGDKGRKPPDKDEKKDGKQPDTKQKTTGSERKSRDPDRHRLTSRGTQTTTDGN